MPYTLQGQLGELSSEQPAGPDFSEFSQGVPLFRKAWVAASLGYIFMVFGTILSITYTQIVIYGPSIDHHYPNALTWIFGGSTVVHLIGLFLIMIGTILIIRGLLFDRDLRRSGRAIYQTLSTLKWLVLAALVLYILYLPVGLLAPIILGYQWWWITSVTANVAFLLLWALPVVIIHALNQSTQGESRWWRP